MKKIWEHKWFHEFGVLIFCFTLFTINDWILISTWKSLWLGTLYFMILYAHAQINRYFLLPILLKKQKLFIYILSTILLILFFAVLIHEVTYDLLYKNCFLYQNAKQKTYLFQMGTLLGSLICILGSLQLIEHYRNHKMRSNQELLHNQFQLTVLKNQLNPHFLFNAFNTLYGINLQYPERTSDMIMLLSQLMRYQIDNIQKEAVCLSDEIQFIKNYIDLEKERLGYRCVIDFEYQNESKHTYQLAPMLFIPFVENAFKHGTCSINNSFIKILITVKEDCLYLKVENSIPEKKGKIISTKIGLHNTKERLRLLYPKQHTLDIKEEKRKYTLNLSLQLT